MVEKILDPSPKDVEFAFCMTSKTVRYGNSCSVIEMGERKRFM